MAVRPGQKPITQPGGALTPTDRWSDEDKAAYSRWQEQVRQFAASGGITAPLTYALVQPSYLDAHPELAQGYRLLWGADLSPTLRRHMEGYHPSWGDAQGGGDVGMVRNSGLWDKWQTWAQIALAIPVGGMVGPAIAGVGAPGAATSAGTTGGGTTAATGAATGSAAGSGAAGGTGVATGTGAATAGTGSATAGTGAATGGTLASTALPTSYVAPIAGSAGISSAEAGITTAGSAPFWDRILGPSTADKVMTGLQLGGGLAGSLIQSRQADKATQAQVDAANRALELQGNIYQQQRADLAPYRNAGAASLSALTYGMGLDPSKTADTTTPYFNQQAQAQNNAVPQNAQRNPNSPTTQPIPAGNYTGGQAVPRVSSLAPTAGDGTVSMMSPDGRQARVPQNQVQAALAAGGRLA